MAARSPHWHPLDERRVSSNKPPYAKRPDDFHEQVEIEMRLLKKRGYIEFIDEHGRRQRIYHSGWPKDKRFYP